MEQWLKDALAEEQGYIICPLAPETYTICNEECEKCEYMKDFKEALKESEIKGYAIDKSQELLESEE